MAKGRAVLRGLKCFIKHKKLSIRKRKSQNTPQKISVYASGKPGELNIERMAVSELEREIYWGEERNVCFIKYNDTIFLSLPVI